MVLHAEVGHQRALDPTEVIVFKTGEELQIAGEEDSDVAVEAMGVMKGLQPALIPMIKDIRKAKWAHTMIMSLRVLHKIHIIKQVTMAVHHLPSLPQLRPRQPLTIRVTLNLKVRLNLRLNIDVSKDRKAS